MKWIVAVFAAMSFFGAATAGDNKGVMVLSYGTDSCGRFLAANETEKSMYVAYAIGFVTGENVMDTGNGRFAGSNWDQAGVTLWLKNYCTNNPLSLFFNAASDLRIALGGKD